MQLGWIDFSKEDRQKVFDVMNLLQEQGAVDELGIGIVRDAFANYFFPGTSTIQTRAKYFLIVSYLLKEAADGRYGKEVMRILRELDAQEKACGIKLLADAPDADGIIGKRVLPRGWVARKPSDIYWNGIRTFGIFKDTSLSVSEYISIAVKIRKQKSSVKLGNRGDDTGDSDRDDRDAGDIWNMQFWNLPTYQRDWMENLTINLTAQESAFLKGQIIRSTEGSLFSYLLANHIDVNKYLGFAALTEGMKDEVPQELAYMMSLACDFNHLVYMARVRYNMILSEGKNADANDEWDWLWEERKRLAKVDLDAVFSKLRLYHSATNSATKTFLGMLKDAFLNGNTEGADGLIRKREVHLKGINRAKLNRTKEHDPDAWVGGGWLDFRLGDARRIINDIYAGEVNCHV